MAEDKRAVDADAVAGRAADETSGSEQVVAIQAASARPSRKSAEPDNSQGKGRPTPKRKRKSDGEGQQRATPAQFVQESVAELKKVVWPTGSQLQQYFVVVLVFVLLVIAYVSALDLLFGWGLLKIFG